jgi:hypothetical protein
MVDLIAEIDLKDRNGTTIFHTSYTKISFVETDAKIKSKLPVYFEECPSTIRIWKAWKKLGFSRGILYA